MLANIAIFFPHLIWCLNLQSAILDCSGKMTNIWSQFPFWKQQAHCLDFVVKMYCWLVISFCNEVRCTDTQLWFLYLFPLPSPVLPTLRIIFSSLDPALRRKRLSSQALPHPWQWRGITGLSLLNLTPLLITCRISLLAPSGVLS